ncbi:MAG: acyl carrier protein [bacterium]|jgi:acyl carrier protein
MSNKTELLEKLSAIIVEVLVCEKEEVTLEAKIDQDLGADSLDKVELIMEIEKQFEISIADDKAESVETVGDIVNLLESLQK